MIHRYRRKSDEASEGFGSGCSGRGPDPPVSACLCQVEGNRRYSDVLQRRSHAVLSAIAKISHQGSFVGETPSSATAASEVFFGSEVEDPSTEVRSSKHSGG